MHSEMTKAQIPLRRLCNFHPNLPAGKVEDTNHVADFHDLYPRLSPRVSFGESRRNGIWA